MFTPQEIAYLTERFRLALDQRFRKIVIEESGTTLYDSLLCLIAEHRCGEKTTNETFLSEFMQELSDHLLRGDGAFHTFADQDYIDTATALLRRKLEGEVKSHPV